MVKKLEEIKKEYVLKKMIESYKNKVNKIKKTEPKLEIVFIDEYKVVRG